MSVSSPVGRTVSVVLLATALLLLGCGDAGLFTGARSGAAEQGEDRWPLAVSPGNHTAVVGESVQYAAVLVDANGDTYPTAVSWSVSDTSVAVISTSGALMTRRSGTTTVTARSGRRERSAPLTVVATLPPPSSPASPTPPPSTTAEPVFVAGTHTSLWHDDLESTATTAALYARYATQSNETGVHLDATGGVNGSRGIRFDWRAKTGCTDDSHFIEGSIAPSQEVVVQYSVRYQPNFAFDWIGRGGPCSGNAKKLFFLWAQQGSRFGFISENRGLGVGSDYDHPLFAQNTGGAVTPEALADGQWHRITLRVRQSSTPTATDGYVHGWIDGVQRWAVNNIASRASGGWVLFKLPTTMNQGSPIDQSEWMDNFRIWRP